MTSQTLLFIRQFGGKKRVGGVLLWRAARLIWTKASTKLWLNSFFFFFFNSATGKPKNFHRASSKSLCPIVCQKGRNASVFNGENWGQIPPSSLSLSTQSIPLVATSPWAVSNMPLKTNLASFPLCKRPHLLHHPPHRFWLHSIPVHLSHSFFKDFY